MHETGHAMSGDLIVLPLPIIVFGLASVAAVLITRADLGVTAARWLFGAFFFVIAIGTLLVGLRFGYGFDRLVPFQRVLPLFAGPFLYLGFAVFATERDRAGRLIAVHLGLALVLAIVPSQVFRDWRGLDWLILLSYLVYALGLLWMWREGPNHLVRARFEIADTLHRWLLWSAVFLLSFLVIDTGIAISFAMQRSDNALALISYGSLTLVVSLVIVIVAVTGLQRKSPVAGPRSERVQDATPLEIAARELLEASQLYLDTELSVDRLAKRLQVPTRSLSNAINQSQGMNVSQYVNGFRLRHAARLLAETDDSVSTVMENSGFLTRSNFYREFQRAFDKTPAAYRQEHKKT